MKNILILMIAVMCGASCQKQNLRHANHSLQGKWQVTEVYSAVATATTTTHSQTETGDLGSITFTETSMMFEYRVRGNSVVGSEAYELERTKENAGFTKVEVYTIRTNSREYHVGFGDETSDAEKKATRLRLETSDLPVVDLQLCVLQLEKK